MPGDLAIPGFLSSDGKHLLSMAQEMHKTKESDRRKKRAEEVLMSQLETLQRNLSSLFRLEEKEASEPKKHQ